MVLIMNTRPVLLATARRLLSGQAAVQSNTSSSAVTNDILYTEDHIQMRKTARKFIETEINPFVDEWEKAEIFPAHEVFKKLGNLGFLGVTKPTEHGGLGLDFSYSCALAEEYGYINCGGVPMAIGVQSEMATPALSMFGSTELKREFLEPAISGDQVCSIGVSEPGGGSDVASVKTVAERKGDDLVINGTKMWITNGLQADWICLLANTSKENGPWNNKSLICVPMDRPGISRAKISKIGMHSSDTSILTFEDVRVPASNIVGEAGMGFMYQMIQFQLERLFGVASILVALDRCILDTVEYTRNRHAFGQPLIDNQVIHYKLAELQTEVEALRSLLYRAVLRYNNGEDVTMLASMAKLKAGRLTREVTDSCLQYWGGMGYSDETLISRIYRDMRLLSIGGGADEVMLAIICKFMRTLPKFKK